jgi:glycerate 2-kinase
MNVLIAPNSMKGSLSAFRFAELIGQAFLDTDSLFYNIRTVPVADGGDQTADILIDALNLNTYYAQVYDPLGRKINASFGYANSLAVIEMANASGMKLLINSELNPLITSSYGTGQLVLEAEKLGAKTIFIGVGGSATVDSGTGMLEALGLNFYDSSKSRLTANGGNLENIKSVDGKLKIPDDLKIKIICDVDNPLLGDNGAAKVFAPQKGATAEMVDLLERGLNNFAEITGKYTGKSAVQLKGSGAAGGLPAGISAWLNAEIVPGADFILDIVSFNKHAQWADLVITGEGKIDHQTIENKAPFAVAKRAKNYGKPVIGIAGWTELTNTSFFDGIFSIINKPCSLEEAIEDVEQLIYGTAIQLAKIIFSICK